MGMRYRDYFSFESIRDKEGEVVCYHVTMIGTIEDGGRIFVSIFIPSPRDYRIAIAMQKITPVLSTGVLLLVDEVVVALFAGANRELARIDYTAGVLTYIKSQSEFEKFSFGSHVFIFHLSSLL